MALFKIKAIAFLSDPDKPWVQSMGPGCSKGKVPMSPVYAHFSKISMYAWGKKRKLLVFTAVYVCVKAKLTLVRFFFIFFCLHLSLRWGRDG